MDVRCPSCAAPYVADDEKLRGKTARMRCKACNTTWLVAGPPRAEDPAPKLAARTRTGSERERRDLFAAVDAPAPSVKETLLPPPSSYGARNESSVLFSLDQLKANARSVAPAPKQEAPMAAMTAPLANDDSGIIDLAALSSQAPRPNKAPVAPLFSEPAPMAVDVASTRSLPASSLGRYQMYAGMAAAAALMLAAMLAVVFAFRGEDPVKRMATATISVAHAPILNAPPKVDPPPPAATPAPASDEASAEAKTVKKGKAGKARAGTGKGYVATGSTKAPASRPVKAADPCHCGGNFNCILACTAGKR